MLGLDLDLDAHGGFSRMALDENFSKIIYKFSAKAVA